jgi:multiple sugar transport system substrate-binding protein
MNVLRPFSAAEIRQLGGADTFVPAVWKSGSPAGKEVWAIPWVTDLSLVYYRRDLLAKAGVDEKNAFQSPQQLEQTLQQLQAAGIDMPWVVPTRRSYITIHNLAMWIWQAGGDFVDARGKTVLLDQSRVRAAIRSYLSLYRYLSPEARNLAERDADGMFISGRAAVTISGPWAAISLAQTPVVATNLGLAIPFGCSYIGGSSLAVWKQTSQPESVVKLITHLTHRDFQTVFPQMIGLLPGRLDSLDTFPLPDTSLYPVIAQGLKTGRASPTVALWGSIEDRFASEMAKIWTEVLASPEPNLDEILDQHLPTMVKRLNNMLSQS